MRRILLLTALLLAACVPAVVTPVVRDVSALEAGWIIADATNTAAAAATRLAETRATQTSVAQSTRDALAVEATRAGIALTAGQARVQATDAAAVRTAAAEQTHAYATPTWAALQTRAALDRAGVLATATALAADAERVAASAHLATGVAQTAVIVALLAGLTLAAIVAWWTNERQRIRTDTFRELQWQRVEQAEAETRRIQAGAIRACILERDGAPWLVTPRGLVPLLPGGQVVQAAERSRAREHRWRAAIKRAVIAGVELGVGGKPQFGERDLAGPWIVNADGTPSSAGYRAINRLLRRAGIWTTAGRDTVFARGWNLDRFEREFDAAPLPHLPEGEPPEVRIPLRSSAAAAISAVPQ